MASDLPPPPNFAAIEAAATRTADSRTRALAMIGNLVFAWSNNESMLVYVLMVLLETDQNSAAIVFSTLNTTRARLDLIQRLARVKIADPSAQERLQDLIERFTECTRIRNEFNHCMYNVNEQGEITHTQTLRIQEVRGRLRFAEPRKLDEARLEEIAAVVRKLRDLNRDIWDFLPRLREHLQRRRTNGPEA